MKVDDYLFLLEQQHDTGPDSVSEHEDNCQRACDAMKVEFYTASHDAHQRGACSVEDEPCPEEDEVPEF